MSSEPATRRLDAWIVGAIVASAAGGLVYWVLAAWLRPDEPFSLAVVYRFGDLQFLPAIAGVGRLNFGETAVWEAAGSGLSSGQLLQFTFYGAFWALFGARGLVVADVVVALAYLLAVVALARALGAGRRVAYVGAALVVAFGYETMLVGLHHVTDPRWGRPHLTVPILFALLALCASLVGRGRARDTRTWIGCAVLLALLVQMGDPFTALSVAFALGLFALFALARGPERGRLVRALVVAAACGAVALVPLVVQRALEHPDIPVRQGFFEVDRAAPLFALPRTRVVRLWLIATVALGLAALSAARSSVQERRARSRPLAFLALAIGVSMFMLPISCVLFGETIQPYHFPESTYLLAAVGLVAFTFEVAGRVRDPELRGSRFGFAASGLLALAVVLPKGLWPHKTLAQRAYRLVEQERPFRRLVYDDLGEDYRGSFVALVEELSREPKGGVLATLDHQLAMWWQAFRSGYTLVPDNFVTTVSDAEIERRFVAQAKVLGADEERFRAWTNDRSSLPFWLGFDKYQLSAAHSFAPLDEYSTDELASLDGIYDSWNLAMPRNEEDRLARLFRDAPDRDARSPRLDVVVLLARELERGLAPPPDLFELSFENEVFRVFRRTTSGATDSRSR